MLQHTSKVAFMQSIEQFDQFLKHYWYDLVLSLSSSLLVYLLAFLFFEKSPFCRRPEKPKKLEKKDLHLPSYVSSEVAQCVLDPSTVSQFNADQLTEEVCMCLVKENPKIMHYLKDRYKTELVCLAAFMEDRSIIDYIPCAVRSTEMWDYSLACSESDKTLFEDVPIDKITNQTLNHYCNTELVDFSLLTQQQRFASYQSICNIILDDKKEEPVSEFIDLEKSSGYLQEFVDFVIDNKININLFRFMGFLLTGKKVSQIAEINQIKLVKLTNYSELHRSIQYEDGKNVDIHPFKPYGSSGPYGHFTPGGLSFTSMCHSIKWPHYSSEIGEYYWRRPVTLEDDAQVSIELYFKLKADSLILGPRQVFQS